MQMLIDTHAHLYWEDFKDDLDQVVQRSLDAGVETVVNIGVDLEMSKKAVEMEHEDINLFASIGIHPHEASQFAINSDTLISEAMINLDKLYKANKKKVVAIGETGLDFMIDPEHCRVEEGINLSPDLLKEIQRRLFIAQINLAKKLRLPVIIHCRDDRREKTDNTKAWEECLEMVEDWFGILHCYSGLERITKKALKSDFLISFAGNVTYPKNDYLREAVKKVPLEKIVLETDCPFLSPQVSRGKRNEPANIKEIAELIAQIKGLTFEQVALQTATNAKEVFNLE